MQITTIEAQILNANKAFARATRALATAETEKARHRHARRAINAQRRMAEAKRHAVAWGTFEAL